MTIHEEGTISIKFFCKLVGSKLGPNNLIAKLKELEILESDNLPSQDVIFKYLSYSTEYYRGGRKKAIIPRVITRGGISFLANVLEKHGLIDPSKKLTR